ncbi:uncharacterized protein DDB_G0290587-like [Sebastes umbrosus]|uniref:uncharacterized protein DDB_G0290587-like n=1 Tax=Sebastes umbrosus TaxID=72105 RepID=UPI00189DD650|nr:uncharacterized protein DDB_G0290587-like [Sebastes umbrosus]
MSCRFAALSVFLLLFHLAHARSVSFPSDVELPEIDGSAVDTCRFFFDPTPDYTTTTPISTTTTTTPITTTTTTTPIPTTTTTTPITTTTTTITKKQVVATTTTTTKKPAVQSPPRKPETKNTGTPVRPQPNIDSLLYYLMANSRGHWEPMGGLPHRGYDTSSESDESAETPLNRAGRTDKNRWKIGSFSSEDSSDES